MKAGQNNSYKSMDHLPELYYHSKDLSRVAEEIWPLVVQNIYMLTVDKDTVSDFCLYLYERLPAFFETYRKHRDIPFAAFLIKYIRNLFYNFIRYQRRRQIKEHSCSEIIAYSPKKTASTTLIYRAKNRARSIPKTIKHIPLELRTTVKLYLGMELNIEELELLVGKTSSPQRAADFLRERHLRKQRRNDIRRKYMDRAAYLQYVLHKTNSQQKISALLRRKNRIQELLEKQENISELTRLAELFCVSKSTISRRLEMAVRYLYQE